MPTLRGLLLWRVMKIYKYKDLTNEQKHFEFYQIVLEKKFWCASPDSLNDADEFNFELDYNLSTDTPSLLSELMIKHKTKNSLSPELATSIYSDHERLKSIVVPVKNEMIKGCRETMGISSFSGLKTSNYLWDVYGGKGNGVRIEIDIPDEQIDDLYRRVDYVPKRIFHIDILLRSALFGEEEAELFRKILLTKTEKWSQEKEIRFIGKKQNSIFTIGGYINEVTFGAQVPTHTFKKMEAKIANHCTANNITIIKL